MFSTSSAVSDNRETLPPVERPREVLIIDDHDQVRAMITMLLGRVGWAVREAEAPEDTMALMKVHGANIGLALVDLNLAETSGLQLARMIHAEYPHVAVVLLSGQYCDDSRHVISSEGFRFLPKPFRLEQLRAVASACLGEA
jgi:DNA-binding NtrC family response regulator